MPWGRRGNDVSSFPFLSSTNAKAKIANVRALPSRCARNAPAGSSQTKLREGHAGGFCAVVRLPFLLDACRPCDAGPPARHGAAGFGRLAGGAAIARPDCRPQNLGQGPARGWLGGLSAVRCSPAPGAWLERGQPKRRGSRPASLSRCSGEWLRQSLPLLCETKPGEAAEDQERPRPNE